MAGLGWLVEVRDTLAEGVLVAVIADNSAHATTVIRNHFRSVRLSVKIKKPLSKDEINRLGLKQGEVRRIWNDTPGRQLERLPIDIAVDRRQAPSEEPADSLARLSSAMGSRARAPNRSQSRRVEITKRVARRRRNISAKKR
jgi:hypothetical protein